MAKRVHVRPMADGKWGVFEYDCLWDSFVDDWRDYGPVIAIGNWWKLLTGNY